MRLVTSMMTMQKLNKSDISKIIEIMTEIFPYKFETFEYKYDDNKYYETDLDLLNIEFKKETIYENIDMLIKVCERILEEIKIPIDFIIGNDDTGTAVEIYEKDWNDISSFGLFVTTREIPDLETYYSSDKCDAYLNFEYVSFGCIF